MIERLHHHGFTVSDLERSLAFYRDLLGLEVRRISERRNLPSYDAILSIEDVALTVALLRHPVDEFLLELFQYLRRWKNAHCRTTSSALRTWPLR